MHNLNKGKRSIRRMPLFECSGVRHLRNPTTRRSFVLFIVAVYDGRACGSALRGTRAGDAAGTLSAGAITPLGRPEDVIMYSGYAEIPCSWRSSPCASPSGETRRSLNAFTAYMTASATAKIEAVTI